VAWLVCLIICTGFSVFRISLLAPFRCFLASGVPQIKQLDQLISSARLENSLELNSSLNTLKALLISSYYALIETQVNYAAESIGVDERKIPFHP
jgi:hypothetical protein